MELKNRFDQGPLVSAGLAFFFLLFNGCSSIVAHGKWPSPRISRPDTAILRQQISVRSGSLDLAEANIAYAQAMESMQRGDSQCVDYFFRAAQFSWNDIQVQSQAHVNCIHELPSAQIYRSSLNSLIAQGQYHQRFDPQIGLRIHRNGERIIIPCHFYGFSRTPKDFHSVVTVGEYSTSHLNNIFRQKGIGVPTVIVQCGLSDDGYQRKHTSFVATAFLRTEVDMTSTFIRSSSIDFYNPLEVSSVTVNEVDFPIAYDKSAAIARTLNTTKRKYVQAFLQPGNVDPKEEGLFMLEPYAVGKIPIVFVHGLLSDRLTWANLVNEIQARPWFNSRYQLWGYEYPTGKPFLPSAAKLRNQLTQLCCQVDPEDADSALKHIVMVGHSMGGLISKLQVSGSGDALWDSIANRAFEKVHIDSSFNKQLSESLFFEPSSRITRVAYIGTPHRGSALAQRAIGRIGSLLIEQSNELKLAHQKLIKENTDTFSKEFMRRIPNSLDLLEPDSPLLSAIDGLATAPNVRIHSIIGSGRWMPGNGDSDGVVPVSSAKQVTGDSERFVGEKHADLTRDPSAIDEILSILREHFDSLDWRG